MIGITLFPLEHPLSPTWAPIFRSLNHLLYTTLPMTDICFHVYWLPARFEHQQFRKTGSSYFGTIFLNWWSYFPCHGGEKVNPLPLNSETAGKAPDMFAKCSDYLCYPNTYTPCSLSNIEAPFYKKITVTICQTGSLTIYKSTNQAILNYNGICNVRTPLWTNQKCPSTVGVPLWQVHCSVAMLTNHQTT